MYNKNIRSTYLKTKDYILDSGLSMQWCDIKEQVKSSVTLINLSKVFYASVFVWPNFSSHGKRDFLPREESGRRFWEFLPPWLLLLMAGFAICEPVDKTDSNREGRSAQFQTPRNSTKSKKKCLLSS